MMTMHSSSSLVLTEKRRLPSLRLHRSRIYWTSIILNSSLVQELQRFRVAKARKHSWAISAVSTMHSRTGICWKETCAMTELPNSLNSSGGDGILRFLQDGLHQKKSSCKESNQ